MLNVFFTDKIPKNISAESDLSPRAKAIQDYVATNSDELSFQVQIYVRGLEIEIEHSNYKE